MTGSDRQEIHRFLRPALALFLALLVTVNIGMLSNSDTLDSVFGQGKRVTEVIAGQDTLNAAYYTAQYSNTDESRQAAAALARSISDEGIVLLKNSGLLPLRPDTPVSPFGLRYVLPYYGGSGSASVDTKADYIVTPAEGLHAAFSNVNVSLEEEIFAAVSAESALAGNPNIAACSVASEDSQENTLYELSPQVYQPYRSSCESTVGIVFIGRSTGENCDASTLPYTDGTPHMLALTSAEKETIVFAKKHCDGVVVVLASPAIMEIAVLEDDGGIDAIFWLGGAGCSGYASLGAILTGAVTPSGKTTDIWPAAFKSAPTFANQDDGTNRFTYSNAVTTLVNSTDRVPNTPAAFREYEEGVYLGYRYYETAWDLGYLTDYNDRAAGVLYPFGYGLSYTSYSQEIIKFRDDKDRISLTVRVTNTGSRYAGKEVVQLYVTPPYTELDAQYDIEKSTAVLLRFAKTGTIQPGQHEDVTLIFSTEDMASYCAARDNGDGTVGSYMLEEGSYLLSVREDSHTVLDSVTLEIPHTVWYDNENPRQSDGCHAAVNQFRQLYTYVSNPQVSGFVSLSRTDWQNTQPTAPTEEDRHASYTVLQWICDSDTTRFDYQTDEALGNTPNTLVYQTEYPLSGKNNGMVLADLRGKAYNDPAWNLLLDQLSFANPEQWRRCLFEAGYKTGSLTEIGKPESVERDGPQGLSFSDVSGNNWVKGVCAYPAVPVMGAAWNQELMYQLGRMVGQEALLSGINGWYAPGLNLRRSPFGGRNFEAFGEDPLLAGTLAAQIISGAGDEGLVCVIKHLGPMDTEAHRSIHTCVWMTEQALREIHLRPFEIAIKTAKKTVSYAQTREEALFETTLAAGSAVMAGDCGIGTVWTAANYPLLTNVLRGEWGFEGFVISDMHQQGTSEQIDNVLRAGCDAFMMTEADGSANSGDFSSATGQKLLRRAVKNLCYTLVNTNLMQGVAPGATIHYGLSPWCQWLIAVDLLSAFFILAVCIWMLYPSQGRTASRTHRQRRT